MLWLPFVRRVGARLAAGADRLHGRACSPSSRSTPALEGLEIAGEAPSAFGGAELVFLGALVAFLALAGVDAYLRERRAPRERRPGAGGAYLALLVAIGIGLHNLGEGLAIGSAYASGALALGAFLVVGFAIHNTTEGLAIVAPLGGERARASAACRPRPDRRRAGDPRRLDRRRRLQPEPRGAAVRGRRRRDRPGDRPARCRRCATSAGGALNPRAVLGLARRDRRPLRDRPAGERLMGHARINASAAADDRGDRGLREGDLRARAAARRAGRHVGARRAARRLAGDGDRDAEADGRARAGRARALPRRRADRSRASGWRSR